MLLITGFTVPILFPVLGYFPFVSGIFDKVKPYLVYPSTIGTYHVRPLPFSFGNAPTIGQSLYIAAFFILTVILTAVNYESTQPNTWFDSTWQEIMAYISCRTGVLAFALAPLVILFSGRNNILLWCTNWSHSTYILLHRWIARIFGLQVIVHSIVELELYKDMGRLDVEQKEPYWIWGIVGTLATCIMLVASLLYMRRWSYEVFLLIHITMAVFVLVGSWYHVELLFRRRWGYEFWLYAACAVWFFDRLVRIIRMAKVGIRRAKVTEVGPDIVRIDVEGVEWGIVQSGLHAYAYFPTLNPWTPWENHPFSIIPTALLHNRTVMPSVDQQQSPSRSTSSEDADIEKNANLTTTATSNEVPQHHYHREVSSSTTTGVTLYIRKSTGRTRFLKAQPHAHDQPLLTLLDGPYHNNNHDTKSLLQCDRLLLIAGGIGITALLPLFLSPGYGHHLSVKLCWSVKESVECLVRDMEPSLRRQAMGWEEKEVIIQIGTRLDLEGLVRREAEVGGWKRVGVVVCGPGGMCDVVRDVVGRIGRERQGETVFELSVEAFSW